MDELCFGILSDTILTIGDTVGCHQTWVRSRRLRIRKTKGVDKACADAHTALRPLGTRCCLAFQGREPPTRGEEIPVGNIPPSLRWACPQSPRNGAPPLISARGPLGDAQSLGSRVPSAGFPTGVSSLASYTQTLRSAWG